MTITTDDIDQIPPKRGLPRSNKKRVPTGLKVVEVKKPKMWRKSQLKKR